MENYRVYIPTTKEGVEIRFRVSFNKETTNWATNQPLEKGYRVNATPITIEKKNGFQVESFGAFTGFGDTLLPCGRRSEKRYGQAKEILEEKMLEYLAFFEKKGIVIEREAKLSYVTKLWDKLGDIPCNDDEDIEEEFLHFPVGTQRYEIWHWFESKFDLSVAEDLMVIK